MPASRTRGTRMRLSVSLVALLWVHGQPDVRVASAALPSWEQRKELWLRGEITDRDKKTWNVLIVPGARWIDARAERGWQDAGVVITSLVQHSFWDKREAEFMTGIRFSNDAIRGGWLNRIGDDFEETRQENESLPPGEMGSAFFPFV